MEITELLRKEEGKTFDEELNFESSSEVIDFSATSECFAEIRKLKRSDLHTLAILAKQNSKEIPTNGGILLFGKNRLMERCNKL